MKVRLSPDAVFVCQTREINFKTKVFLSAIWQTH